MPIRDGKIDRILNGKYIGRIIAEASSPFRQYKFFGDTDILPVFLLLLDTDAADRFRERPGAAVQVGTSKLSSSIRALSIPTPYRADNRCSTVEIHTPRFINVVA